MNPFIVLFYRFYQKGLWVMAHFLPYHEPELIRGPGSIQSLAAQLQQDQIERILVVTDKGLMNLHLLDSFLQAVKVAKIEAVIFDKTVPNPTIDNIEEALLLFHEARAQAIVAFGGGSPMDVAKAVGARVARPNKTIPEMRGILKVGKRIPPLYAIPTTAGTGSETTLAAVVTNSKTHEKYAINDPVLIPSYAVLDPELTVNLPPFITATTGLDALTHAVEAYLGKGNTRHTKQMAVSAIKRIHRSLITAYQNGSDLEARADMQLAAYEAGVAFTRAYVGNVHAIAHTFGGFYQVPHGLANAVLLPQVLEYYGIRIYKKLAQLSDELQLTAVDACREEKALAFLQLIKKWNKMMDIPKKFEVKIQAQDLPIMVERANKEANPLYPVPVIFRKLDFERLMCQVAQVEASK